MTTLVEPVLDTPETNTWKRFGRWSGDAWRLLRRSPFRFVLLALLPLAVEGAIQLVPGVGIVLSKCLVPIVGMWILYMIDAKARHDRFAPLAAARALAARPLHAAAYVAVTLVIFAFQLGAAAIIGGIGQAAALAAGNIAEVHYTRRELALLLAAGALPAALTLFAAPRLAFSNESIGAALRHGIAAVMRNPKPAAVYALCTMELTALLVVQPLILLILLPWFGLIGYAAWRDVEAR